MKTLTPKTTRMMRIIALAMLPVVLGGCYSTDNEEPKAMTKEDVSIFAAKQKWVIDTSIAEHETPLVHTGLSLDPPKNQDEVLAHANKAWGLPKRATGKALRIAFKQRGMAIDTEQSLQWVDAMGRAGIIANIAPKTIVSIYLQEHRKFQALGISLEEAIAVIAGVALVHADDTKTRATVRQLNDALLDESVRREMAKHRVRVQCKSGFDVLSQLDLAQRQHPAGKSRDDFIDSVFPLQWRDAARAAMHGGGRKTVCDLIGQMRCARGYTYMQMEPLKLRRDNEMANKGEYNEASWAAETVIRATGR